MAEIISRVMFTGDDHLSSKNYGGHQDYPKESMYYFKKMHEFAKEYHATHWISLGDFTYGRFGADLNYRQEVEHELESQLKTMNGNHWMIKGNHDTASNGMTEYEFYAGRLFKTAEDLEIGNVVLHMRDYGDMTGIDATDGRVHIIVTHGFFSFKGANMNTFGAALMLDDKADWAGVQYIISGHIHEEHVFKGFIGNGSNAYPTFLHYLPCNARPAYHREETPTKGAISFLDVYDNGEVQYNRVEFDLLPIQQCFNVEEAEKADKPVTGGVDLSDIVGSLDSHEIKVGNPEDIIMGMEQVPIRYREKAVDYLKQTADRS